ncbi:hypothetical protein K8Z49_37655 [Actinomadura madurae]|uniref:hypothetical protein n=1 Tax=Actinomadura madurae TaxID=1993 RepID=UPI00399B57F5
MVRVQAVATGDPSVAELRIGRPGPSGAGVVGLAMLPIWLSARRGAPRSAPGTHCRR